MDSKTKILNKFHVLLLAFIILLGVFRLVYLFSLRDGHHVDEAWSYGYANSYYDPFIYSTSRYGSVTDIEHWKNLNEWLPGTVFKDYVTVSEDQRFSFDSVLYNKEFDLGPALYTLILHFVSSFFPGVFSWSFAFSINLVIFVFSLIFVYYISFEFTDNKFIGLFVALFYIFSGCGTANYLYLRIYSLFTFLALALFYVMVRFIKKKYKNSFSAFVLLPLITILGCMTHYYFLIISFFLTLFSAIALFVKKRYFDALKFCTDMLVAVMIFFVLYRPALNMLMPYLTHESSVGGSNGYSNSYRWNISAANIHFFQGTVGFFVDFSIPLLLSVFGVIIFSAITLLLFAFLFRNEKWFKKFLDTLKNGFCYFFKISIRFFKKQNIVLFIPILSSIAYFIIIPFSVSLSTMGFIERYLFAAMSLFLVSYLSLIGSLLIVIIRSKLINTVKYSVVCALICCLFVLSFRSNMLTDEFKFTGMNEKELTESLSDHRCYVMTHAVRDMVWLSPVLANTEEVYIDLATFIPSEDHIIPQLDSESMILLNLADFLTEEQKEQYEGNGDIELIGLNRPTVYMTADDYVDLISEQTGLSYSQINEFPTFIGNLRLYKVSGIAHTD